MTLSISWSTQALSARWMGWGWQVPSGTAGYTIWNGSRVRAFISGRRWSHITDFRGRTVVQSSTKDSFFRSNEGYIPKATLLHISREGGVEAMANTYWPDDQWQGHRISKSNRFFGKSSSSNYLRKVRYKSHPSQRCGVVIFVKRSNWMSMGVLSRSNHRWIDIFKTYRLTDHIQSGKLIARDQDTSPDIVLWQPKSSPLELILRDPVGSRWDFLGHAPGAKKRANFVHFVQAFFLGSRATISKQYYWK